MARNLLKSKEHGMNNITLNRNKKPLKLRNAVLLTIGIMLLLPAITDWCTGSIISSEWAAANTAVLNSFYGGVTFCITLYVCYRTNVIEFNVKNIKALYNKKAIILICLVLEYCVTDIFIRILAILPLDSLWNAYDAKFESINDYNWLSFLTLVILVPMAEEMLFRGILYNSIKAGRSACKAAVVSSLLFSLAHFNVLQCGTTFICGIVYCIIYEKYNSLAIVIFMHMSNNLLAYFQISSFKNSTVEAYIIIAVLEAIITSVILYRIIKH